MKKVLFLLMFIASVYAIKAQRPEVVSVKATGDTAMIFTVTTQSYGGTYAPKHCLAIWITDNNNVFKKTLKLAASTYKVHLVKWNQMSGGNVTDAITGATLTSHTTHTVVWNGKDKNGTIQPDGTYKVYIEFTENNSAQSSIPDGPWTAFTFTKGITQTQNPANVNYTYNNTSKLVYKSITIQTFGTSGIDEMLNGGNVSIYPNPTSEEAQIRVSIPNDTKLSVTIYNMDGKIVHQFPSKVYEGGEHIFFWYPQAENAKPGIYFVKVASGLKYVTYKLIVS